MKKDSPPTPTIFCFSAPRSPRLRVTVGSDAITPIPPNGFALAAKLHFMLSGRVAFLEQNSLFLARMTEILAQLIEELAFVEPDNPITGNSLSMNS
jgi:hypothetical protein